MVFSWSQIVMVYVFLCKFNSYSLIKCFLPLHVSYELPSFLLHISWKFWNPNFWHCYHHWRSYVGCTGFWYKQKKAISYKREWFIVYWWWLFNNRWMMMDEVPDFYVGSPNHNTFQKTKVWNLQLLQTHLQDETRSSSITTHDDNFRLFN